MDGSWIKGGCGGWIGEAEALAGRMALELLRGCGMMRESQKRRLCGTEAPGERHPEQRYAGLDFCAEASSLIRNFPNGDSSLMRFPVVGTCVTVGEPFLSESASKRSDLAASNPFK
jgi:hypothetical protein